MNQPWYLVGIGGLLTAFGAALAWIGLDADVIEVALVGWTVGSIAGLVLFVGLIALGVEVGVRGARR